MLKEVIKYTNDNNYTIKNSKVITNFNNNPFVIVEFNKKIAVQYVLFDLVNPIAAKSLGRKIFKKVDMIRSSPDSCALADNEFLSNKSVLKLLVDNYIIYYKVLYDEKIISIVRIIYEKCNLDGILKQYSVNQLQFSKLHRCNK